MTTTIAMRKQLFINGQWIVTGATFGVTNPATGETIAEVADGSDAEALEALDAAEAARHAAVVLPHDAVRIAGRAPGD